MSFNFWVAIMSVDFLMAIFLEYSANELHHRKMCMGNLRRMQRHILRHYQTSSAVPALMRIFKRPMLLCEVVPHMSLEDRVFMPTRQVCT